MSAPNQKTISIVAPCFNEALVLDAFLERVRAVVGRLDAYQCEFLFVDDGSTDETPETLRAFAASDPSIKVLRLSRNFGHQRAITAGLDRCSGDYIVVIDADLQDPPELIPEIIARLEEGYDVVHTVRADRSVESFFKRVPAKLFYRFMRKWVLLDLVEDAADFKGFNRRVLAAFRLYRERVQFLRGAFAALGFRQTEVRYSRAARHAGRSKYPTRNVLRLARDAIVSNSALPLRTGLYLGVLALLSLPIYATVCLVLTAYGVQLSVLSMILIGLVLGFGGMNLVLLGLVGEYLKCIILEVKHRPLYVIESLQNLDAGDLDQTGRS